MYTLDYYLRPLRSTRNFIQVLLLFLLARSASKIELTSLLFHLLLLMLQFSSLILKYSLFLSFPIATIGEAVPCLTIAFFFSLVTILFPYLVFSSLIYGLILSSTGSLTLVSIPCLHNVLLVSFYFLP